MWRFISPAFDSRAQGDRSSYSENGAAYGPHFPLPLASAVPTGAVPAAFLAAGEWVLATG